MPYGIVVTRDEIDLVDAVFPPGEENRPAYRNGPGRHVTFEPKRGREIVNRVLEFELGDLIDANARTRFLGRIAQLCGPALLTATQKPVDDQRDLFHDSGDEHEEHF